MWQLCACGYHFGPPEPKVRIANSEQSGKTVMQRWLDGSTPAETMRALRLRILWSWGAMLALAAAGCFLIKAEIWVLGFPLVLLAPVVAYLIRLRIPVPWEFSFGFTVAVNTLWFATVATTIRPPGLRTPILLSLCAATFILLIIQEVRSVRMALRLISTGSLQADASPISTQEPESK
jgi:hypothetical protein